MPKFIALPVSQGDAFFIQTQGGSALIDGGRSVQKFAALFTQHTGRDGVDVLVATHNDADHANGVLGFLRSGLKCGEVWLPGRWAQVMEYVLRPGEEVVYLLARQVQEIEYDFLEGEGDPLERYAERIGPRMIETLQSSEEIPVGESGWPQQWIPLLERVSEDPFWELCGYLPRWWWYLPWRPNALVQLNRLSMRQVRLLDSAIIAAKRIRKIALEAYHRGIPVRWFKHDPARPSISTSWLKPLSAREISIIRPPPVDQLCRWLALTTWNKESLVLWATPGSAGSGVLFTADSDLANVNLPAIDGTIVTAPHHGSEANKAVYQLIASKITGHPPIWVRSDGKFRKRPCHEYLTAPGRRFCTLCRDTMLPKQVVSFFARSRYWVESRGIRPCSCI